MRMKCFMPSAILAVSVAGLGMVGMFWLGSYLSQVMKALKVLDGKESGTDVSVVCAICTAEYICVGRGSGGKYLKRMGLM